MMTPEEFADLPNMLFRARKAKGVGQEKVAREIDVAHGTYRNWEKGRTKPDVPNFFKLCDYFGWDKGPYLKSLAERDGRYASMAS